MNRSQLVDEIASTTGLTRRQAEQAVDAFVGTIGDQVRSGTKVTIYGFGSFNPTSRKARTGRNPRTGQPVKIAASKGIRFSPATGFKADLNLKKAAGRKAAPAKAVAAKATTGRATASRATAVKTAPAKAPAAKANGTATGRTVSARATKAAKAAPVKANGRKAAAAAKATAPRPVGRPKKAAVVVAKAPAKKVAVPARAAGMLGFSMPECSPVTTAEDV